MYRLLAIGLMTVCLVLGVKAEDGSRLWLRMDTVNKVRVDTKLSSATINIARTELETYWKGADVSLRLTADRVHRVLGNEGYTIQADKDSVVIGAVSEIGLLYGVYHLLRLQATGCSLEKLDIVEKPAFELRVLNHWDNLDGTIERGYAGSSLWQWDDLPGRISPRYEAYARANASIGVNGTILNNVNASPEILSDAYLTKVKALADVFRPYGLKVYLSVNFASPIKLGGLQTADPLDEHVIAWWKQKVKAVYALIPDFGGFLVKANSEGQPGPCDYHRTHAEGANMLARILKPYGGVVFWRAFVYSPSDEDRAKQAYLEFMPLDGMFLDNVILQIKNGPVDFQPREPYSPLFGAMKYTKQMAELQITQEYLGHSNHLVFLASQWSEFFQSAPNVSMYGVAGVSNIGDEANWCGHDFAQANWYAFGRMAWNPHLTPSQVAEEWVKQTFTTDAGFVNPVKQIMLDSYEAAVNYMMPLGLHHIFAWNHHYGPEPWCSIEGARPDWLPAYYHRADSLGIGFDRTLSGSGAVSQYPDSLARVWGCVESCPEKYLLWFHHVPWTYRMQNGHTLWEELCEKYNAGLQAVRRFRQVWNTMEPYVDADRYNRVAERLKIQENDAVWWKDACLLYFQTYSKLPFPTDVEPSVFTLDELKAVKLPISNYECPQSSMLPDSFEKVQDKK